MIHQGETNDDVRFYDCLHGGMMVGEESQLPQLIQHQSGGFRLNSSAGCTSAVSRGQLKEFWAHSAQFRRHYRDSDCDSGIFSVAGDAMTSSTSNDSTLDSHLLSEPEPESIWTSYRQRSGSWPWVQFSLLGFKKQRFFPWVKIIWESFQCKHFIIR